MKEERKKLIDKFIEINSQINLSAIRDEEGIYVKHILDSLELNKILKFEKGSSVCDVGTGGGFPLMPLAITNPDINFYGMDSIKKKISAVGQIIEFLDIINITLLVARAEEYKNLKFDYVVIRAVGYVDKLWERTKNLIKSEGYLILYKIFDKEEKEKLERLLIIYGGKIEKIHKYKLFDGDIERVIYVVRKKKKVYIPKRK